MPALVVAMAGNPAFSKSRALATSQAFGSTNGSRAWCNSRRNRPGAEIGPRKLLHDFLLLWRLNRWITSSNSWEGLPGKPVIR